MPFYGLQYFIAFGPRLQPDRREVNRKHLEVVVVGGIADRRFGSDIAGRTGTVSSLQDILRIDQLRFRRQAFAERRHARRHIVGNPVHEGFRLGGIGIVANNDVGFCAFDRCPLQPRRRIIAIGAMLHRNFRARFEACLDLKGSFGFSRNQLDGYV